MSGSNTNVHPRATPVFYPNPRRWTHKQLIALRNETRALELQGVRLPVRPDHNPRIKGICTTVAYRFYKPSPIESMLNHMIEVLKDEGHKSWEDVGRAMWTGTAA